MTALTSTVRTRRVAGPRALGPIVALAAAALAALPGALAHAATPLADQPLFAASDAPGNLALVLSVEFPTAISVAHLDRDYHSAQEYLGFFDPAKCYRYVGQAASTASAVTDGSFENPPQNGGYTYGATGGAWTFDNGGGLTSNQSAFTNGNPNTTDGSQVAFLQLGGRARQTITLTAGTTYYVSFRAAQRGNYQSGTQSVRISIDGDTLGTFTPPSTSYSTSPTYSYTATSGGTHTIQLVGTGGGGGDYTAFVDSVVVVDSSTPVAETLSDYYRPVGLATARRCSGEWSGNFLNWATMQVIDPFRWVLTGGYRVVDTPTTTVVEKAWGTQQGSTGNFPDSVLSAAEIAGATPFGTTGTPLYMRIWGLGNKMRFALPDPSSPGASPWLYGGASSFSLPSAVATNTAYEVFVRAQVCDTTVGSGGPEANCTPYGANYKPEGLIQKYSNKIRYSAFAYLNDDNILRDGGVLRARQTFVGPTRPVPGSTAVANAAREWNATTGVFIRNPSPADATATNTLFGTSVQDSGVMNYLNKFGEITPGSYKTYDNVSELYYAAIRYFKNQGNVPEWTDMSWMGGGEKARLVDGFPVITEWDDPILYSCQRNFILGIGDVNTHADKNVPGNTSMTANEPAMPAAVRADNTLNAVTATDRIGVIEGISSSLGSVTNYNGCCSENAALIAGLAYETHTKDIRPNDFQTAGVARDPITIDTYWVDILEYLQYKPNNQFYLAAKYGGFKVPKGYSFQNNTTPLDPSWWSTNADNLSGQRRPDNYFTGGRPDLAAAGLTAAFADIASKIKNYTTSFSTSLPQVAVAGNASYSSQYDAAEWKGEIKASELSFDAGGIPQMVEKWNFSTLLAAQLADTGWSTSRRVATWNTETLAGVPFRAASISGAQRTALDTLYASGDDSTEYVNYLRGDQSNETNSVVSGSSKAYRHRSVLLGDIVGSKARPIGPPSFPYSDAANPGYATFKQTWSTRPNVVYVGANDGMLHAINGSLSLPGGGVEMFAYVPGAVYQGPGATPAIDGLAALGNPTFSHRYFVNATPNVYDIDFGRTPNSSGVAQAGSPDWRSVLIGGLGKGGRSYYALDVTDPAAMASGNETALARKVLWEFSDPDLGFSYGEPIVTKTRKYGWVVIFVSGYNNTTGQGYFFLVNPRTGALLEKVSTGLGSTSNDAGLANVNAFVYDASDGTADAAYAGDLLGNVWRLDLTAAAGTYPAPKRFAVLTDSSGTAQPVTSRPSIEVHPSTKKRFVMLGTGRMLATSDIASSQRQTFYVIADGNNARFNRDADLPTGITFPIGRARLAANVTPVTSGITYDPNTQMGWYEELGGGTNGIGWRVTSDSSTFAGSVAFAATLPDGSICNPSGSSRIYARDYAIGATTVKSAADAGLSPVPYVTFNGTVTDLRYLSVGGRATLISGTDLGSVTKVEINPAPSLGLRRLNWRELPLVE